MPAEAAKNAVAFGADTAFSVENAMLDDYADDSWVAALQAAARETSPDVVLLGQTMVGRDLAPRFAVRVGHGRGHGLHRPSGRWRPGWS